MRHCDKTWFPNLAVRVASVSLQLLPPSCSHSSSVPVSARNARRSRRRHTSKEPSTFLNYLLYFKFYSIHAISLQIPKMLHPSLGPQKPEHGRTGPGSKDAHLWKRHQNRLAACSSSSPATPRTPSARTALALSWRWGVYAVLIWGLLCKMCGENDVFAVLLCVHLHSQTSVVAGLADARTAAGHGQGQQVRR